MAEEQREIGGYFELERFEGHEYHEGALALNCARSCLAYLIEARGIKRLWTPWYLCGSVDAAALSCGAEVMHFEVGVDFRPRYEGIRMSPGDYLYLVDYYGQLSDAALQEALDACDGRLVVDEVMAFFRKPMDGVDTIYSCRKFFGVSDGAYLYTTARIERDLETDESHDRMGFVLGRCERPSNDFYPASAANNKLFATEPIKWMSPITHNILRAIDYELVAARRRGNFERLAGQLGHINELSPVATDGAFMYPLLIEDGARIRKELQAQKLYVSMLWDHAAEHDGTSARFARDILPMPIDQRYSLDDMDYECRLLREALSR